MKRIIKQGFCFILVLIVLFGCQAANNESEGKLSSIRNTVYGQLERSIQLDIDGDWQDSKVELKPTNEFDGQFFNLEETYTEDKIYVITFKSKNPLMGDYIRLADSSGKIVGYNYRQ